MQALFETFVVLVLTLLAIIGVGGFLFLFAPKETKRWRRDYRAACRLMEKYPPEDR